MSTNQDEITINLNINLTDSERPSKRLHLTTRFDEDEDMKDEIVSLRGEVRRMHIEIKSMIEKSIVRLAKCTALVLGD